MLSAIDADVIKTYVEVGLGVGIVASMAYSAERDGTLVRLDLPELAGDADFEKVFIDSTIVRAHQHAAGAAKKR